MSEVQMLVGDRIDVDGEKATIRFVGTVGTTKGEWLGVEWDNPERGKNDGSKDGVGYFSCRHKTGGSFLRQRKVNCGVSLLNAVKTQYLDDDDEQLKPISIHGKTVEMIGCSASNQELEKLKSVSLLNRDVSSPGPPGQLSSILTGVVQLSLNGTLISSWEDVNEIICQLPKLKSLDLSRNFIRWRYGKDENKLHACTGIENVILNKCALNWKEIVDVSNLWPNVKTFCLSYNNILDFEVQVPNNFLNKLHELQLNGNPLHSWSKLKTLNNFPSLEILQLDNCGFDEICVEKEDLQSLKSLSINENNFVKPDIFNHLNRLTSLEKLFCLRNPINKSKEYQDMIVEIMVAKIAGLQKANNMKVTNQLRLDSELDYLRFYGAKWRTSGGHQDFEQNKPNEEFLQNHPRYMQLIKVHGAPQDSQIFKKTTALKGNLIELRIVDPQNPNFKTVTRKLPRSMKISSLKLMVQKLTRADDVENRRLVYVSKDNPAHVVKLNRNNETLHDVSIENGDTVKLIYPQTSLAHSGDAGRNIESNPKLLEQAYGVKQTGFRIPN